MLRTSIAFMLLVAAPVAAQDDPGATATLFDTGGNPVGEVTFTEGPNGVLVRADLTGLPAGWHGFHVHQTGSCDPDFGAAGDHFAPDGNGHGILAEGGRHAGDLPNIAVAEDGTATADFFSERFALATDAGATLNDADGSAVIVHAQPDSYGADAQAGDRIACGVIEFGG